jgi:hypothetical protein
MNSHRTRAWSFHWIPVRIEKMKVTEFRLADAGSHLSAIADGDPEERPAVPGSFR